MAPRRPHDFAPAGEPVADAVPPWSSSDLAALVDVLRERWWYGVTVFIAIVVFAGVWTLRQTPLYRATARVEVAMRADTVLNVQDVVSMGEPGYLYTQYMNTQVRVLRSRQLAERVVTRLGLHTNRRFAPAALSVEAAAGRVVAATQVQRPAESRLLDIVVEHADPEVAASVANGLASEFVAQNLDRRMQASIEAVEWLRRQADDTKAKLEASERAMREYRLRSQSVSLEASQDIVNTKLRDLNMALTQAQTQRMGIDAEWNSVRDLPLEEPTDVEVAALVAVLRPLGAHEAVVARQGVLVDLQQRYKSQHPAVVELRSALREECRRARATIEARQRMAVAREAQLLDALRRQEQEALDLDRQVMEYAELRRAAEVDRQFYQAVITRMKEAGLAGKLETNNLSVADRAVPASRPFKPRVVPNLLAGVGAGLCGALLAVGAAHFLDNRLRRREDIEQTLGLPVVAMVPSVEGLAPGADSLMLLRSDYSPAAESFRALRASLALSADAAHARVWLVTSAAAGDGKTFVASNLALAFAQNGLRTLLVDADLRRPCVHRMFGLATGLGGLSGVLAGQCAWREACLHTETENLHVIPAGRLPPRPAELLGSPALRGLIEEASAVYDRILFDCPPVGGVSDPLVLLPAMQCVLFVVRHNCTHRYAARHAVRQLQSGAVPIPGVICNGVDADHARMYSRYERYDYVPHTAGPSAPASSS